jgi:hypothetical protein
MHRAVPRTHNRRFANDRDESAPLPQHSILAQEFFAVCLRQRKPVRFLAVRQAQEPQRGRPLCRYHVFRRRKTRELIADLITGCCRPPQAAGEADAAKALAVASDLIGVDRVPLVSGIDRTMFGFLGCKLAAERVVADSGLPWTTLWAAQFHGLLLKVAHQMTKLPVIPVSAGFRFQPVDADEIAARLVELRLGTSAGQVPEIAGPQVYAMADLLRGYLRARGKHRLMMPVRIPGTAARAFRTGPNLAPERAVGHGPGKTSWPSPSCLTYSS